MCPLLETLKELDNFYLMFTLTYEMTRMNSCNKTTIEANLNEKCQRKYG